MQGLDGFLDFASRKLDWIDQRTRLLAGNVANSDTPGFRPRDLRPFADDVAGHSLTLASTNAADLDGTGTSGTIKESGGGERAPDGNAVSVEHQMKLIADDQQDQQLVTTLYRKYMSLDQTALGIAG